METNLTEIINVENVRIKNSSLVIQPPLSFNVKMCKCLQCLNGKTQCYIARNDDLCIEVYSSNYENLLWEIEQEIILNWKKYAEKGPSHPYGLTSNQIELRNKILKRINEEPLNSEKFNEWFNELENFGFRSERFYFDFENGDRESVLKWLEAAYNAGYSKAKTDE